MKTFDYRLSRDPHPRSCASYKEKSLLLRMEEMDHYSVPLPQVLRSKFLNERFISDPEFRRGYLGEDPANRPSWATQLKPVSRHSCFQCFKLRPSNQFTTSKVTGRFAKIRDRESPSTHSAGLEEPRLKRVCIPCEFYNKARQSVRSSSDDIRWVEGWERELGLLDGEPSRA